jgi:co-chaperonin GroES (HSP10)
MKIGDKLGVQISAIKGKIRPILDRVLVSDMHFGDTTTNGGIIVLGDDGKDRGIHPRWAKVFAKGPENKDPYEVGDWILIEHGRWTRGFRYESENGEITLRMAETKSIMLWSSEQPISTL